MSPTAFPAVFVERTRSLLGDAETRELLHALDGESPVSIRFNPYKIAEKPEGEQVPWCRYGYYLDRRPSFTLDPAFHAGAYYVQEAGSMFLESIFRQTFPGDEPLRVLDLCAAPGGKTTLLSTLAGAESLVVANEPIRSRASVLAENARKWGIGNIAVTCDDPSHLGTFEHYFDLVVVDAPCSGEGMFRKDLGAREEWSERNTALCAARQRRILSDIWPALRPGGVLVYSTCTFNTAENEDNVRWLAEQYDCERCGIETDPSWGIVRSEEAGIETFRFYPHRTRTEGFFAAALRKGDGRRKTKVPKPKKTVFTSLSRKDAAAVSAWTAQPEYMRFAAVNDTIYGYYDRAFEAVGQLAGNLTVICSGVRMGQLFGGKLKPDHALAMFHDRAGDRAPRVDLELPAALDYLRKKDIDAAPFDEGINLVCHEGLPLGWIKRIGRRTNNLYPKESRILQL